LVVHGICNQRRAMPTAACPSRRQTVLLVIATCALSSCSRSLAASAEGEVIFVSNEDSGDISVIDSTAQRVTRAIAVGKRPRGLRINPDGKTLYVALSGSPKAGPNVDESQLPPADRAADGIGVVDVQQRKLVKTLPSGADPESFDLAGEELVVSNEDTARASFISLTTGQVERAVAVGGEPEGVTTSPDGRVIYVTSEATGEVSVLERASRRVVAQFKVGERPRAVAFTPDGARAYVTNELGGSVSYVDARRHQVLQTIALPAAEHDAPPARPMGIVIAPDGEHAYVTTGRGRSVAELSLRSNSFTRVLPAVGARPWGIGISGDGTTLYAANGPSNDVSVIDIPQWRVTRRIPVGRSPWGIAVGRSSAVR
jgi:YVTN family beta-propeller protein